LEQLFLKQIFCTNGKKNKNSEKMVALWLWFFWGKKIANFSPQKRNHIFNLDFSLDPFSENKISFS
jgi:hypothetical protein